MKPVKKLKNTIMKKASENKILLLLLLTLFFYSCEEKPVLTPTSIEGFYTCNESSAHTGYRKYLVEIDKVNTQDNLYIIANFHNLGDNEFLYAEYTGDTLYIRNQVIGSYFVTGKGKVFEDFKKIDLEYVTDDGLLQLDYYAAYER